MTGPPKGSPRTGITENKMHRWADNSAWLQWLSLLFHSSRSVQDLFCSPGGAPLIVLLRVLPLWDLEQFQPPRVCTVGRAKLFREQDDHRSQSTPSGQERNSRSDTTGDGLLLVPISANPHQPELINNANQLNMSSPPRRIASPALAFPLNRASHCFTLVKLEQITRRPVLISMDAHS